MRRTALLRCVLAFTALAGCRDKAQTDTPPPAPKLAATRDAGAPDARRAPDALSPAAGSWGYTRPLSKCVVQVLTSPPTERARVHDAAAARLAALGGTANVEMTYFGDRVARVDFVGAKHRSRPPRTPGEAQLIAIGALAPYSDLFGLSVGELMKLDFITEKTTDTPSGWETYAMIERTSTGAVASIGSDEVAIDLDRQGALAAMRVGNGILPPVTTCEDTLTDDEVRRAVIGSRLAYDSNGQHYDEGVVEAANISRIDRKLMTVRGSAYDGDVVVGAVYLVTVRKNDNPWWIFVDPSTGDVIETRQAYDD